MLYVYKSNTNSQKVSKLLLFKTGALKRIKFTFKFFCGIRNFRGSQHVTSRSEAYIIAIAGPDK